MLFDPWMDFSQLLSLLLAEPGLEGLKHSKLLPVLRQNLVLVPGVDLVCHHDTLGGVLDHAPQGVFRLILEGVFVLCQGLLTLTSFA